MHFAHSVTDSDDSSSDEEYTVMVVEGRPNVLSAREILEIPGLSGLQIGSGHVRVVESRPSHSKHRPTSSSRRNGGSPLAEYSRKTKQLSESKDPPSRSDMNHVCKYIGKHWRNLASALGMSRGQIESIERDYCVDGQYEMAYQTLLKWKRLNGDFVTVQELVQALDSIGMSELASELPVS